MSAPRNGDAHVAVVFPGQGSQFAGMADVWMEHPIGRQMLESASEVTGRDIVAGCRDDEALATTEFVQPAMLACDVAAFRVLEDAGVAAQATAGHSLGEYAALVATGCLTLEDAVRIVMVRGRAMQAAGRARSGAMSALLGIAPADAVGLCEEARGEEILVVANENSPQQVVISGTVAAVERAETLAAARRIRAVRLNVAGAFHSPLMGSAVEPLSAVLDAATFAAPRFPLASNVTGDLVDDPEQIRTLAKRQVVSSVRWEGCARSLAGAGCDTFVEAGPGNVLTKLAKRVVPDATALAVGSPAAAREVAALLG